MNNRGGRMKRDKAKIIIVYILMFIILCLVGYLIYFAINLNKDTKEDKKDTPTKTEEKTEISDSCIFNISLGELASLEGNSGSLSLCAGYNKLTLDNIVLDGKTQNVYLNYYNGTLAEQDNILGVYINDKKVVVGASYDTKNVVGVFDNLLFIKTISPEGSNVRVFNSNGRKVYDLESALSKAKIQDPVFTELAKTDTTIGKVVNTKNINSGSFAFTNGVFTFNTDTMAGCNPGQVYKGSTYKVTYTGETFSNPTFVSYINC